MPAMNRWRGGTMSPFDWSGLSWLPMFSPGIRIEEFQDDDHHVVRAELPGIDPEQDLEITCAEGELRVRVRRVEEERDKLHSEFHYGSFFRAVPLPAGAREDDITARYADGILTIVVPTREPAPAEKTIPIEIDKNR